MPTSYIIYDIKKEIGITMNTQFYKYCTFTRKVYIYHSFSMFFTFNINWFTLHLVTFFAITVFKKSWHIFCHL